MGGSPGLGDGQRCSWIPQTADSEPSKDQNFHPGVRHHSQPEETDVGGWMEVLCRAALTLLLIYIYIHLYMCLLTTTLTNMFSHIVF